MLKGGNVVDSGRLIRDSVDEIGPRSRRKRPM